MVKISDINRTSTFAWSLDSLPLLATGTVAGAVDISFHQLARANRFSQLLSRTSSMHWRGQNHLKEDQRDYWRVLLKTELLNSGMLRP